MRSYVKQNDNLETLQPQTRVFPDMTSVAQATIPEGEIFIVENIGMYIRLSNSNVLIFASAAASGVVGEIRAYCSSTPPTNDWIICDGSQFDTTLCPELYSVLGSDHVPDLREYATKMGSTIGQFDESEIGEHRHVVSVSHKHNVVYRSQHGVQYSNGRLDNSEWKNTYSLADFGNYIGTSVITNRAPSGWGGGSSGITSDTYITPINSEPTVTYNAGYMIWGNRHYSLRQETSIQYVYPTISNNATGSDRWFNIKFGTRSDIGDMYDWYNSEPGWTNERSFTKLTDGTLDNFWNTNFVWSTMSTQKLNVQLNATSDVSAESGAGVYYIIRAK